MTTQAAVDYFAVLQDKYGSPALLEDEIVDFLNHAINEYLNRVFPDNQGAVVNFEQDKNVTTNVRPLLFSFTVSTDSSGLLTDAALNAAIVSAGAESTATWFRIGALGSTVSGTTYPVKYLRENEHWAFERNYFKKASTTRPQFELYENGVQLYPATTHTLSVSVVKKPQALALSPAVNPEFDDYVMYNVIAIALQLAGVSTRDETLIEDVRNVSLQAK